MNCQAITKNGKQCSREAKKNSKFCWQHQDTEAVNNDDLTDKQEVFCEEYLIDLNATQAAIRAGYSENNAGKIGHQLLEKTRIKKEIQRLKKARSKRTQITADRVLKELARLGYSKITDYLEVVEKNVTVGRKKDGTPITERKKVVEIKETSEMDPDKVPAISEIKETKHGISLKLHDKIKALHDMGKHLDMFTENIDITMNELPDINLIRGTKNDS